MKFSALFRGGALQLRAHASQSPLIALSFNNLGAEVGIREQWISVRASLESFVVKDLVSIPGQEFNIITPDSERMKLSAVRFFFASNN